MEVRYYECDRAGDVPKDAENSKLQRHCRQSYGRGVYIGSNLQSRHHFPTSSAGDVDNSLSRLSVVSAAFVGELWRQLFAC